MSQHWLAEVEGFTSFICCCQDSQYLSPQEMDFLCENYISGTSNFPALIAEVFQHMEDGTEPDDPCMRQLAMRWQQMVRSYAGDDPQTQVKLREAMVQHPELLEGSGIDMRLLGYVRQLIMHFNSPG